MNKIVKISLILSIFLPFTYLVLMFKFMGAQKISTIDQISLYLASVISTFFIYSSIGFFISWIKKKLNKSNLESENLQEKSNFYYGFVGFYIGLFLMVIFPIIYLLLEDIVIRSFGNAGIKFINTLSKILFPGQIIDRIIPIDNVLLYLLISIVFNGLIWFALFYYVSVIIRKIKVV